MKISTSTIALAFIGSLASSTTYAANLDQYASTVLAFSSKANGCCAADKALGAPNENDYHKSGNAWAPINVNGAIEYIALGYTTPVYAYGVTIREVNGNGFVTKVELRDTSNVWHIVWDGKDPSQPGSVVDFFVSWEPTPYRVNGVRITINTNRNLETYEQIDSVQLSGVTDKLKPAVSLTVPDPGASEVLSSPGLFLISRGLTATTAALTVQYNIAGGALNGADYNSAAPLTGTVTIPANQKSAPIWIKPVNDNVKEYPEAVTLSLVSSINYQVANKLNSGTVTIYSDE